MTRQMLLREVRRQAVPAAALVALTLLLVVGWAVFAGEVRFRSYGGFSLVPLVIAALAPYLLGVAAVAPDVESGGEAFLARLPLRRGPLLLLRGLVAAGWSAIVLAVAVGVDQVALGGLGQGDAERVLVLGVGSLAAGLLASVTLRWTLLAFLLGPALVAIPAGLYGWSLEAQHLAWSEAEAPLAMGLAGVLLACAWTYLRGDLHRPGWRPLGVTSGVLAGALALGIGGTRVVAETRAELWVWPQVTTSGEHAVVVAWRGSGHLLGLRRVEPEATVAVCGPEGDRTLEGTREVAVSPDGRTLVGVAGRWDAPTCEISWSALGSGEVLARRTVAQGNARLVVWQSDLNLTSRAECGVGWVEGRPWVSLQEGDSFRLVELGEPGRDVVLPADARLVAVSGPWALARDAQGWGTLDLRASAAPLRRHDVDFTRATLAGGCLVGCAPAPGGQRLRWMDLEQEGRGGELLLPEPPAGASDPQLSDPVYGLQPWPVQVEAMGGALFVSWTGPSRPALSLVRVDLRSGVTCDLTPRLGEARDRPRVLGSEWVARGTTDAWELVSSLPAPQAPRTLHLRAPPSRLLSADELLLETGEVVDPVSGAHVRDALAAVR